MMLITELHHHRALLNKIAEVAGLIHQYGWAEANAGNLSIEVTSLVAKPQPETAYYLVSRSGSRYRQTAKDPLSNLLLVECSDSVTYYPADAKPTMEWISHRCLQHAIGERTVVLHTHPAEIIALAHLGLNESALNQRLAELLPELPLYLPEGFAVAPHCPPGSQALCDASLEALKDQKALIWSGHGLLCFGSKLDEALDYMEIMVKAAKILLLLS